MNGRSVGVRLNPLSNEHDEHTMTRAQYLAAVPAPSAPPRPIVPIAPVVEPEDLSWKQEAACLGVDPALFFPELGESTAPAKAVCKTCPVIDECLDYALRNHEHFGIWGGMSERQRRDYRKRLRASLPRKRQCHCGTPFMDTTKNGQQRWCTPECRVSHRVRLAKVDRRNK